MAVNCGAIPAELIESELFGHTRGRLLARIGIGEGCGKKPTAAPYFWTRSLRRRLRFRSSCCAFCRSARSAASGSNQTRRVDVRVIAASNRNIEEEVNAGRFRDDLFYRLNAVSILLPPLRERREDIPPLAQAFADRVYSLNPAVRFSPEAVKLLERYPWPGNIREFENAVVRAAAMCDGLIRVQDLPERIRNYSEESQRREEPMISPESPEKQDWPQLSEIEGRYVARVLEHTGGNKQAASRVLGVDRKTLDRMIKRHNIEFQKRGNNHSAQQSQTA